jgi:mono/diheme cytochrome c family protein
MGVKKGNRELKNQLDAAIGRRQVQIRTILEEYGVPLMPADVAPPTQDQTPQPTPDPKSPPAQDALPATTAASGTKKLNPFTGNADMVREGRALYGQIGCQGCHGGGGGGGMAVSLIDENWKFGSDDETLYKLIKGQISDQTMPTVYSVLQDEQVWKLLAFIRSIYIGDPSTINW